MIWNTLQHNKSLDASGGSVFLNFIPPAMLECIRAAASTQTLYRFLVMKTIFPLLGITVLLIVGDPLVAAQTGCALVAKNEPAQSLSFERVERVVVDRQVRENVVLRLRNNSTCDITLLSFESDPRALEIVKNSDGTVKVRIAGPDDYPDGARLEIKISHRLSTTLAAAEEACLCR